MSYDWPREMIDVVTALWFEGHSASEIARRVGMTKNAVIGKIHRLGLPGRPSPINRTGISQPRQPRRIKPKEDTLGVVTVIIDVQEPEPPPKPMRRVDPCCYIIRGEGRRAVYCDEPAIVGSPYCEPHHVRCHARQFA